ncbi:MAG TPA: sugar phosphate nucleotidyltransferase [Candidatus Polarisedimenticolaceae bacterium]|nr:sugar phosphate nucleotidyltransferase [Candidatus Polarisedimenticolaceae bacterium]
MRQTDARWAVVLGAGDGTRLHALTGRGGVIVPKQFCLLQDDSLIDLALRRAERVVCRARITVVVAARHRWWWRHDLRRLPERNVIVQPKNRGTAPGILLPLLSILARDERASIVLLPSDHYVDDEATLQASIEQAFDEIERDPRGIVLLGITPDGPETDYGWIVPGERLAPQTSSVVEFVEKPAPAAARRLLERRAAWNSFVIVARVDALLRLYAERAPELLGRLAGAVTPSGEVDPMAARRVYAELTARDFSRDLLHGSERSLRLVAVPPCGWTDLGTPERVATCAQRLTGERTTAERPSSRVDLLSALSRFGEDSSRVPAARSAGG